MDELTVFPNRHAAGKKLAEKLIQYKKDRPLILGIARGGVEVAYEVAKTLEAQLDVLIVRKLGAPTNPEYGVGALSENDTKIIDEQALSGIRLAEPDIREIEQEEFVEMERRKQLYRDGKPLPLLKSKTVIIVDDGLATGVTALAAIAAVKKLQPQKIIFAVPVAAVETIPEIAKDVNEFVCLLTPRDLGAIGNYYKQFPQTSDVEVIRLLRK